MADHTATELDKDPPEPVSSGGVSKTSKALLGVSEAGYLKKDMKILTWAALLKLDKNEVEKFKYRGLLVKKTLANKVRQENTLDLPADMATVFARGHSAVMVAALACGLQVTEKSANIGLINYKDILNSDDEVAQTAFERLYASKDTTGKTAVNTVLALITALLHSVELIETNKNPGYLYSIVLLIECYYEQAHSVSPSETREKLMQNKLRHEVLNSFKEIFATPSAAEVMLQTFELSLKKLYNYLLTKEVTVPDGVFPREKTAAVYSSEYIAKAEEMVRPTISSIFQRLTRIGSEYHPEVKADKKKKIEGREAYTTPKPEPPTVKCDLGFTSDVCKPGERADLQELNAAMAAMRSGDNISYCKHSDLRVQYKRCKAYVEAMYRISDASKNAIESRRNVVRTMCLEWCRKQTGNDHDKSGFDKALFARLAGEYMKDFQGEDIWTGVNVKLLGATNRSQAIADLLKAYVRARVDEIDAVAPIATDAPT